MSIQFSCPGCGSPKIHSRSIDTLLVVAILLAFAPSAFAQVPATAAPAQTPAVPAPPLPPSTRPSLEFPSADPLNQAIDAIKKDKTLTTLQQENKIKAAVETFEKTKIKPMKLKWDAEIVDVGVSDKATSTYTLIVAVPQLSFLGNITITQPIDEIYASKLVVGKNKNFQIAMTFKLVPPDLTNPLYTVARDTITIDNAPAPPATALKPVIKANPLPGTVWQWGTGGALTFVNQDTFIPGWGIGKGKYVFVNDTTIKMYFQWNGAVPDPRVHVIVFSPDFKSFKSTRSDGDIVYGTRVW
jgi:hypothetical protein